MKVNDEPLPHEERRHIRLTEHELDYIIKGVKKQAMDEIYADIGKGLVRRVLWILGAIGTAITGWLTYKGINIK